jgi:hypothetical protein
MDTRSHGFTQKEQVAKADQWGSPHLISPAVTGTARTLPVAGKGQVAKVVKMQGGL